VIVAVEGQDVLAGQQVHRDHREAEGQARVEQHHQREERAAVDHQQDQRHDHRGDDEQQTVDAAEGVGEVPQDARRSGHVRGQTVG
jgi:hypothetical protein